MRTRTHRGGLGVRRGVTMIEAVTVNAVIGLAAGIVIPITSYIRSDSATTRCAVNVKQFTLSTASFANDNGGFISPYTAPAPAANTLYPLSRYNGPGVAEAVVYGSSQVEWASLKYGDSIRRLTRPYLAYQLTSNRLPISSAHLPLMNYSGTPFPSALQVCPSDAARQSWRANPMNLPYPGSDGGFSSSYFIALSALFPDRDTPTSSIRQSSSSQGGYFVNGTLLFSTRRMSEVAFPSRKVAWHETFQRHNLGSLPRPAFFMNTQANPISGFFDGSVRAPSIATARPGRYTLSGGTLVSMSLQYDRAGSIEDLPWTNGSNVFFGMNGAIRWTSGGLSGFDFD